MKIAIFIKKTTFHLGYGGLETQNKLLAEGLAGRGHSVYVFSPKYELQENETEQNKVKYVFIESNYRTRFGFSKFEKMNWVNLSAEYFLSYHRQESFDVILGQSSAAVGILRHRPKIKVPVVSISHGSILNEFSTRLQNIQSFYDFLRIGFNLFYALYNFFGRQREFVTHSKRVIVVSEFVRDAIINETFVDERNVEVIYNGVDPKEIFYLAERTPSSNNSAVKLIYVGQLFKSKGIDDLLKALHKFIQQNGPTSISLDVVGSGDYIEKLKELATRLNLNNYVRFPGKIKHEEVLRTLNDYDIFVLPSRRKEGFPMTVVEAMFAGLPVIGAAIGGVPEAIENNVTGLTYESGNIDELYLCLSKLIKDKRLRANMGIAARTAAVNKFTLDIMIDKYEKVLKGVKK
uniref:Glycosyltransferase family 1 protein n=1 Tax=candidate division WWE3 bacterium TaxID=2053526 RepID=A0A7C4XVD1_UNCKA